MQLDDIKRCLAPAINRMTTLPNDIKQQVTTIHGDLEKVDAKTTAANVKTLITQMMDAGSVSMFATGSTFTISAVFFLQSYFSSFSLLVTPVTVVITLANAALLSDSYQVYKESKELNEWHKAQYPAHDAEFTVTPEVYARWNAFTESLKYKTWLAEPLARTVIEPITDYLRVKSGA